MSKLRTLVESPHFTEQLGWLENQPYVDEALDAVTWALARKPEVYPIIPGTNGLRVAKTIAYERDGVTIPPIKIWFSIEDDGHVYLRALTIVDLPEASEDF